MGQSFGHSLTSDAWVSHFEGSYEGNIQLETKKSPTDLKNFTTLSECRKNYYYKREQFYIMSESITELGRRFDLEKTLKPYFFWEKSGLNVKKRGTDRLEESSSSQPEDASSSSSNDEDKQKKKVWFITNLYLVRLWGVM